MQRPCYTPGDRRAQAGLRVYALDLLGNGYTDKLDPVSQDTMARHKKWLNFSEFSLFCWRHHDRNLFDQQFEVSELLEFIQTIQTY